MKLNYPIGFDLKQAQAEGRTESGRQLFIHSDSLSVGFPAKGDEAIEELFVPTADPKSMPAWTMELYEAIIAEFQTYRRPA